MGQNRTFLKIFVDPTGDLMEKTSQKEQKSTNLYKQDQFLLRVNFPKMTLL